ncbi:MAG: hypothetical protein C5B58_00355 [Acidobacteria bacterium]|nr:MAG: hypothetical protein C5B58_00355 [Acidobacteriota bacterium]
MGAITHAIEVNAPVQAVYNQWIRFEEFPRFMGGIDEVRPAGPSKLFWRAKIGGKEKQWEAAIIQQIPNERIAWQSVEGAANRGAVTFEPVSVSTTRITLTMEYEPEGFIEQVGDALGLSLGQVAEDLNRFRDLMEKRGDETVAGASQTEHVEIPAPAGQVTRGEDAEDSISVAKWTERKTSFENQESPEIVVAGTIPTDNERTGDNLGARRDEALHRGEHSSEASSGSGVPADKGFIHAEDYEKDDPRTGAGVPTMNRSRGERMSSI